MFILTEERRCTPEEYLALERSAENRNEYVDGRMIPRPPSSRWHSIIAGNLLGEFHPQLRGSGCRVLCGMRVKVGGTGAYLYPDVAAHCGEARLEDEHQDTLLNPVLVIEVLSKATEAFDRGEKFAHYRRLESLREYVLITQDKPRVEVYVRQGDRWRLSEFSDPDGAVPLESLGCSLSLRGVYHQVDFSAAR